MESVPFSDLGLPPELTAGIEALGYEVPSPIQVAAIPPALEGSDIVGLSETGSGKTAAFVLPALAKIRTNRFQPQVLILCPTRELAVQVCEEVHKLALKMPSLNAVPLYGGAPIQRQMQVLKRGVHLVVGTPGRLLDHLRRGSLDPSEITTCILDEADRMLDMGFREEMEELLAQLPQERQTMFFSATMNRGVKALIEKFGNEPETIEIERQQLTVESIDQICFEVRNRSKIEVVSRILDIEQPRLAMVFCNTKKGVDECTDALLARGYGADRLHGDIAQMLRERVIRRFREGTVDLLVATDVAARGLDVDNVDLVINYDLPQDPEDYVHRVGRTGRAGRSGKAISFYFGRDAYRLKTIERFTNQQIPRQKIPTQNEVSGHLNRQLFDVVRERLEIGDFDVADTHLNELRSEGHEAADIAAAVMAILLESTDREGEEIAEDNPAKARKERKKRDRDRERPDGKGDRGKRFRERPAGEPPEPDQNGMVKLFFNIGKAQRIQPGDLAGLLHNEAELPRGSVGRIHMSHKHSLVEVKAEHAKQAIEKGGGGKLRGKSFRVDYDRGAPKGHRDKKNRKPRR